VILSLFGLSIATALFLFLAFRTVAAAAEETDARRLAPPKL
jgi:hypothetical protein